ncbi:hypothetical protein RND81_13G165500 [Saponaria officinalis]|uniref:Uncharacterized protein n=1 Tax=Saponaria officinalis TaxID=3572 RepID=A0AAW1H428_SAPOF
MGNRKKAESCPKLFFLKRETEQEDSCSSESSVKVHKKKKTKPFRSKFGIVKSNIKIWAICGDFNCVLSHLERLGGKVIVNEIVPFQNCLAACGLYDVKASGSLFTWKNKQKLETRVYSRLDRFLINDDWLLVIVIP